ncbi:MAG: hypothetical protein IKZ88_07800 [Neisseriaceae bacterium]|nr:hypothetical protein [Neisseriaceae bacterium]
MKYFYLMLFSLVLTACTAVERFDTDKTEVAITTPDNKARLKITSSTPNVFAIPDSKCIALSKTVKLIDNKKIPINKEKNHIAEHSISSINMPQISLSEFANYQWKFQNYYDSYVSREIEIDADKPFVIFVKKPNNNLVAALIDDAYTSSFAYWFIPQKNHDYQVLLDVNSKYIRQHNSAGYQYTYRMKIFDISNDQIQIIEPPQAGAAMSYCKE